MKGRTTPPPAVSTDAAAPLGAPAARPGSAVQPTGARQPNWSRFWIQMISAMVLFNIAAGLITWYFIFPHLRWAH